MLGQKLVASELERVDGAKDEEEHAAAEGHGPDRDLAREQSTADDRERRARAVAQHRAHNHPPVVAARRHGNRGDLTAISPFAQECECECLYKDW